MLPEFLNTALAFPSIAIKINLMLSLIIKPGAWDKRNALPGCLIGGLDLNQKLKEKIMESLSSVVPVTAIVLILGVTLTPMPLDSLMLFLTGAAFLIIGMGFFTLGAELAMIPIGEKTGLHLAAAKHPFFSAAGCFFIGFIITMAEPDLQVLAGQTPAVPDSALIFTVSAGVGLFLALAYLKIRFGWRLSPILLVCYGILFLAAFYVPKEFLAVAFDSGGVTTGPITVPFIMALGIGFSSLSKGDRKNSDSFGIVALCSIGPIFAVMLLGFLCESSAGNYEPVSIPTIYNSQDLWRAFIHQFPHYGKEVILALFPILLFFVLFQFFFFKLRRRSVVRILVGILYSCLGLTLFLTGVNVGFMPAGNYLGQQLAVLPYQWVLIPIAMFIGYYIVKAEPAVQVLNRQVEEISGGSISQKAMMNGLSLGMAVSLGLSMLRILTGLPLICLLLPGYILALGLSFFVPPIFTSIAFDSGGVASGPMTATFLLPFAMGACEALGGDILLDAFGIVAMVAMTPLIIIQLMGLVSVIEAKHRQNAPCLSTSDWEEEFIDLEWEDYHESN